MCGGEGFNDMEDFGHAMGDGLPNFLKLPNDIPTHDTFHRLHSVLAPDWLLDSFLARTPSIRQAMGEGIVAMDGKALRRTMKKGGMPCVVSAWAVRNGLVPERNRPVHFGFNHKTLQLRFHIMPICQYA